MQTFLDNLIDALFEGIYKNTYAEIKNANGDVVVYASAEPNEYYEPHAFGCHSYHVCVDIKNGKQHPLLEDYLADVLTDMFNDEYITPKCFKK